MTKLRVFVDPDRCNRAEYAWITLSGDLPDPIPLEVEYTRLKPLGEAPAVAHDFLLLAAAVYAADKAVDRRASRDAWTREISLTVPVSDPERWSKAADGLHRCVSFLSGDRWAFSFEQLGGSLPRPDRPKQARKPPLATPQGHATCLFSGGLDSLVGAIDWLSDRPLDSLFLVGHHDPGAPGPLRDQRRTLASLPGSLQTRAVPLFIRVRPDAKAADINMRSRSLLFIALGVYVAAATAPEGPVLIPENGMIALNPPLGPSRSGSCSTRTAHPHYLDLLRRLLKELGLPADLQNPLASKTKGEVLAECADPTALAAALPHAVSCAKRNRRGHWQDRSASHCGHCVPCLYRRAAVLRAGLPSETFGVDVLGTDRDFTDVNQTVLADLRAVCSFVRRDLDQAAVVRLLRVNAPLPLKTIGPQAAMVLRAVEELRELLRVDGVPAVRRLGGVVAAEDAFK